MRSSARCSTRTLTARIVPALAKSITVSPDGLTITIGLRPGVKFSDGTPLNAAAVVANYKRDLDPANACQCLVTFSTIKNVAASGDNVVLTMSAPMAAFAGGCHRQRAELDRLADGARQGRQGLRHSTPSALVPSRSAATTRARSWSLPPTPATTSRASRTSAS